MVLARNQYISWLKYHSKNNNNKKQDAIRAKNNTPSYI